MQNEIVKPQSMQNEMVKPQSMQNEMAKPQSMQNEAARIQSMQNEVAKPQVKQNEVAMPQSMQNKMAKPQAKKNEAKHRAMQNDSSKAPKLNGRFIMNAIRRLGGSSGTTIVQIKKYLQNEKKLECDVGSLKLYLKNSVGAGKLSLLDGKYTMNEMASASKAPKLNGRYIMNAIRRLGDSNGSTIVQIKKHLQNEKKLECDTGSIKLHLENAVGAGKLSLLDGKYMVNETARRRRKSSGGSPKRRKRRSGSRRKSSKRSGSKGKKRSGSRRRRRSKKAAE